MSSHVHCQINSSGNLLDWCDVHDVEMPVTMKFRINASMKVICFTTVTETIEAFSGSSTQAATMLLCLVMLLTWIGSCSLWTVSNWWCWKVSGANSRRQEENSRFDLVIFFQMRLVRLGGGTPWRVIVGLPSTKGSTAYAEAVTSSLKHCSKVICSVSEKRADFGHWKIVDVRAKKQGVAADVCDILCLPAKLYSQTSRNLFPPSFCLCSHSSFINGFLLLRLPSVCSCLDGRCSNTSPSQIKRRLYNSRQHRTHKCNSRAKPLNLFWGHEEGAWIPHGCSRHKISKRLQLVMEPATRIYGWKKNS